MSSESLAKVERQAVVAAILDHPHWTLSELFRVIDGGGPRAKVLAGVTVGQLRSAAAAIPAEPDPSGAQALDYDQAVLATLFAAAGPVAAGYLRERVGGRRWTLLAALRRLEVRGLVDSSGRNRGRRYWLVDHDRA